MSAETKYYWIDCSEDGDVSVMTLTKDELERRLNDPELYDPDGRIVGGLSPEVPGSDPMYWEGKSVIIKGEIVVPTIQRDLKKWELP